MPLKLKTQFPSSDVILLTGAVAGLSFIGGAVFAEQIRFKPLLESALAERADCEGTVDGLERKASDLYVSCVTEVEELPSEYGYLSPPRQEAVDAAKDLLVGEDSSFRGYIEANCAAGDFSCPSMAEWESAVREAEVFSSHVPLSEDGSAGGKAVRREGSPGAIIFSSDVWPLTFCEITKVVAHEGFHLAGEDHVTTEDPETGEEVVDYANDPVYEFGDKVGLMCENHTRMQGGGSKQ